MFLLQQLFGSAGDFSEIVIYFYIYYTMNPGTVSTSPASSLAVFMVKTLKRKGEIADGRLPSRQTVPGGNLKNPLVKNEVLDMIFKFFFTVAFC